MEVNPLPRHFSKVVSKKMTCFRMAQCWHQFNEWYKDKSPLEHAWMRDQEHVSFYYFTTKKQNVYIKRPGSLVLFV